jgi:hypothetical protein
MTQASPFVAFSMTPTSSISSTPVLIFGSQNTCILTSILIANQVNNPPLVSLYLLRESEPTPGNPTEYSILQNYRLEANARMDVLAETSPFNLESGDTLYAFSDDNSNLFNTFVSYRELQEVIPVDIIKK